MPAGGLFSTAADMARFGQMLLRGGELDGKRYLSEAAVKQMTSRQTPLNNYGFGYAVNGATFGHGGAYSTNISIDPQMNLVLVFMVQNAGWRNDDGKKIQPAFTDAAVKTFGAPHPAPPASGPGTVIRDKETVPAPAPAGTPAQAPAPAPAK
jgi:CubicO group peptidase (beta-lactamase class C family)